MPRGPNALHAMPPETDQERVRWAAGWVKEAAIKMKMEAHAEKAETIKGLPFSVFPSIEI